MRVTPKPGFETRAEYTYGLSPGTEYVVLGIEADDYRIIADVGGPVLYPANVFDVLDPTEPNDWVSTYGDEGERYAYPPELARIGFFEDYHDDVPEAIEQFNAYLRRIGLPAPPQRGG